MGLRKMQRKMVQAQMKQAGIVQPNRTHYKHIDAKGNPTTVTRKSFFSMHWRDNKGGMTNANQND